MEKKTVSEKERKLFNFIFYPILSLFLFAISIYGIYYFVKKKELNTQTDEKLVDEENIGNTQHSTNQEKRNFNFRMSPPQLVNYSNFLEKKNREYSDIKEK